MKKIKTVWTFHDCWAFTGHCMHFENADCDRWLEGCGNCPAKYYNPRSRVERSSHIWRKKKRAFSNIDTLTIVTPSDWLANLARNSFFKENPIVVINNGIDLEVFSPRNSDFKRKNKLEGKFVVLGVASDWNELKGLDAFLQLAKELDDQYVIVLVGVSEKMTFPNGIIGIKRTDSQTELAEIYSASDVFVNPTREDTFPTVNIEALACGTPVITYKTGGSPEIIDSESGIVIEKDDYESLKKGIEDICEKKIFKASKCIERAQKYRAEESYAKYVDLYEEINTKT